MQLSTTDLSWFTPMSRRQAMSAGAASAAAMGIGTTASADGIEGTTLLDTFRFFFDQQRKLGQSVEPGLLLPSLIAQTHTVRQLSERTGPGTRQALLKLGSRYAEYVGWLVQEGGDNRGALWWTRRAVALATEGEDHHLAAYGLVRHAPIMLYRNDAAQTIDLAHDAGSRPFRRPPAAHSRHSGAGSYRSRVPRTLNSPSAHSTYCCSSELMQVIRKDDSH